MTTLLVDGDVVAYNACEDRYRRNPVEKGEHIINGNLLTDIFDKYDHLSYYREEADFTDEENEEYLHKAFASFKDIIKDLGEVCFADTIKVAVAGNHNFRKDIFPEYKANRHADATKRNPFVPIIRKMAAAEGAAIEAEGMEADDLLRIWAQECMDAGEHFVVASIDKDLKMIPGMHYLIHKKEFFEASQDFAMRFYYEQLLHGDPTDNIQGIPGIGPVKAKSILENCVDEVDFQAMVMQTYYSHVHQWRHWLQLTGQLIYLKKHKDDWFDMRKWPTIELEDIVSKPKKSKKMEDWTVDAALAAINPYGVTTRERWEAAMLFLLELGDLPQDDVDILMERDKVPLPEKEAYERLCRHVKDMLKVKPPELPKPVVATPPPKLPELPVFSVKPSVAIPLAPVTPPVLPTVAPPPVLPKAVAPPPTGVPLFNPNLLKKK
jgi:5'-3' exonuclease